MKLLPVVLITSHAAFAASTFKPSPKPQPVGALYVMSNNPAGNVILSHNIYEDGTLSFASGTPAGGVGSHVNSTGLDPLLSQNPIRVVGNRLYVVNTGSNTFSVFNIDPSNPTRLSMIGKPIHTGGDFPNSLAVSPTTGDVCVTNTGKINNVACFTSARFGPSAYTALGSPRSLHLPQVNPPTTINTLSDITFSPNGSDLLVSYKTGVNESLSGYISTWSVNRRDGSLSTSSSQSFSTGSLPVAGKTPFGMTYVQGGKGLREGDAIIAADLNFGFSIYDFRQQRNNNKGVVGKSYMIPNHGDICWVVYSTVRESYFLSDGGKGVVTEVQIDTRNELKPTIVNQYQLAGRTFDQVITNIKGKDYLYVLESGNSTVEVLSLPKSPKARSIQVFDFGAPAITQKININVNYLTGITAFIKGCSKGSSYKGGC